MKKINIANCYLIVILVAVCFSSCKSTTNNGTGDHVFFYKNGKFFIKEIYDSSGKLITKQFVNKDTIPNGVETDYYPNGKLKKWKWFENKETPYCIVFYNTNAGLDSFKCDPFIREGKDSNGNISVTMINPPNVKFVIHFKEFFEKKCIRQLYYDPTITDSTSWIVVGQHGEYKYQKGHRYILDFYIVDSSYNVLSGANTCLELLENGYVIKNASKPVPSKLYR